MNTKVDRLTWLAQLERLVPVIQAKGAVPLFENLIGHDGRMRAFNGYVLAETESVVPFSGAVKGTVLYAMLKRARSEQVAVVCDEAGMALKAGKSALTLPWSPDATGLPSWDGAFPRKNTLTTKLAAPWHKALRVCRLVAGDASLLPEQSGIILQGSEYGVMAFATDNKTLTRVAVEDAKSSFDGLIGLPTEAANHLIRLAKGDEVPLLQLSSQYVRATLGKSEVVMAAVRIVADETFQRIRRAFELHMGDAYEPVIALENEWWDAFDRATIVAPQEAPVSVFSTEKTTLTITTDTPLGRVVDTLPIPKGIPSMQFRVSIPLLQRMKAYSQTLKLSPRAMICQGDEIQHLVATHTVG